MCVSPWNFYYQPLRGGNATSNQPAEDTIPAALVTLILKLIHCPIIPLYSHLPSSWEPPAAILFPLWPKILASRPLLLLASPLSLHTPPPPSIRSYPFFLEEQHLPLTDVPCVSDNLYTKVLTARHKFQKPFLTTLEGTCLVLLPVSCSKHSQQHCLTPVSCPEARPASLLGTSFWLVSPACIKAGGDCVQTAYASSQISVFWWVPWVHKYFKYFTPATQTIRKSPKTGM